MNLENYQFNITKASNNEFILSVNGANYLVGEVVYIILKGAKETLSIESILNQIKTNPDFEEVKRKDIETLINDEIIPLLESKNIQKSNNPVKSLFILLRPSKYNSLFSFFNGIFSPIFFWTTFIVITFFSVYFLIINDTVINSLSNLRFGWIITFIFTLFIIFFHEIGHTVAASRYKVIAKEIGFGFYFIYPALYTDLSEIWKLHKKERIIINLGGIYFQMIINLILALVILILPAYKLLLISFFISNMAMIFFNLNPLFKFDAYWIFSDFFEIHNLRNQSNKVLLSVIKKANFPKIELKKRIPLVIYSICYLIFMILVWMYIGKYFYNSTLDIYQIYSLNKFSTVTDFATLKKIFWFGITLFLVIKMFFSLIEINKKITKPIQ